MTLPASFKERMKELLCEEFESFMESYQTGGRLYGLRINVGKLSKEEFERINPFALKEIPWISNGFYYDSEEIPARHPYYYAGLYYVQEPSAMTPASLFDVQPGELVLDLCAAPGGKTTELAAKTAGKGIVVANDISSTRAKAVLKNVERCGYGNVVVMSEQVSRLKERFGAFFDKILIDAPCSGEGMFRKDPGLIKSWEERGPESYAVIQKELITEAADMLRPGGQLMYSTCTFSPEENEAVIQYLLEQRDDFRIIDLTDRYEGFCEGRPEWITGGPEQLSGTVRVWPHKMAGEGHYIALLQKIGLADPILKQGKQKKWKIPKEAEAFFSCVDLDETGTGLRVIGEKLLAQPDCLPDLKGLRILRSGLYLGDIKRNRFEPSQALAMYLKKEQFSEIVSLRQEDERVIRYLKGETLDVEDITGSRRKGWQLVCVDGYPLGFGKLSGGTLKNKYYAGWRWGA